MSFLAAKTAVAQAGRAAVSGVGRAGAGASAVRHASKPAQQGGKGLSHTARVFQASAAVAEAPPAAAVAPAPSV